jgi:hypothetical protein
MTVIASAKETTCFFRLLVALAGSYSKIRPGNVMQLFYEDSREEGSLFRVPRSCGETAMSGVRHVVKIRFGILGLVLLPSL